MGAWELVHWKRVAADGSISYPLGTDAQGTLLYTPDGGMSAMMTAADRPPIAGGDPLGGDPADRAAAYATCLAYAGTWQLDGNSVVHHVTQSLYPDWAGTVQSRPLEFEDGRLVLRTPPGAPGTAINEMAWSRPSSAG